MKKITASIASLAIAFLIAVPASACIGSDGQTTKGTDGAETNCIRPEIETQEHFSVDENELDYGRASELDRSYTKTLTVTNNTGKDVIIDMTAEKNGKFALADWVAFVGGSTHFTIHDGASNSIGVRVYVPSDATAGSQYATIKISDANGYEYEVLAKIDIAVDGFSYNSEVTSSWVNPVNLSDKNVAGAKVKNTGNAGFAATYEVKKKNFFGGMDWDVLADDKQEVKPGSEVEFKDESEIGFGVYNVEQRVTFVNAEGRIIESKITRIVINVPIWLLAVIGGIIVLLIIVIVIVKKHKKHNKKGEDESDEEEEKEEKKGQSKKKEEKKPVSKAEDFIADDEDDDEITKIAEKLEEGGEKITVHFRD
ncbi:hypothetical protein IK110_03980 [Candidatus Saccharibacteria bacterium]|nr:hypothetical protein [Candidatus Saccharibacteria bacterium]